MGKRFKYAKGWTKSRAVELDDLCRLVNEIISLRCGAPFLERFAECVRMAEKLTRTRHTGKRLRLAFMSWLRDQTIVEIPD
jgi:hypothetical protein